MLSFVLGIVNIAGSSNLLLFVAKKYNWLFLKINNFFLIYCLLNFFFINKRECKKGCLEFFDVTLCIITVIISSVKYIITNSSF
jgi:hypothetical protein